MKRGLLISYFFTVACLLWQAAAWAGQAPAAASDPDIPLSHRDRVYSAEQFSNTVSVTDPVDNRLVRQVVHGEDKIECRYLVIAEGHADNPRAAARQS